MTIQVTQITGDVVELAFPPREEDLRVGDVLSVIDRQSRRGLIVQILEIRTGPGPLKPRQTSRPPRRNISDSPVATRRSPKTAAPQVPLHSDQHLAIARIRKLLATPDWQAWDGWVPTRDAVVTRAPDREILHHCLLPVELPLTLGRTLGGEHFAIDTQALCGVNIVSGADDGAVARLASVVLRELIAQGRPCLAFDLGGTSCVFSEPPDSHQNHPIPPSPPLRIRVGDDLKLDIRQCSPAALLTLLTRFGLPKGPALYVVSQVVSQPTHDAPAREAGRPPFLGIDELIQLIGDQGASGDRIQFGAILGCLNLIKQEGVLASTPADMALFQEHYATIRQGGGMIVDLSTLTNAARGGVVRAIFDHLVGLHAKEKAEGSPRWPCLVLEEPQLYFTPHELREILMRASSLGLTSLILTTWMAGLEPSLLRRTDNLWLLPQRGAEELRCVANSGLLDHETATALTYQLGSRYGLLVGKATRHFPMLFAFETVDGASATPPEAVINQAPAELSSSSADAPHQPPAPSTYGGPSAEATLPLFPEEAVVELATPLQPPPTPPERAAAESSLAVSLPRIIARWDRVIKRVGRRRRILETILSTARPVHLEGRTLLLVFPPQSRFQQELMASPEYRGLLEEELANLFGVPLEVTATLQPLSETPRR